MTATRRSATIVGALFIIAMAASLIGGAMVDSVLAGPDTLAHAAGDTTTLTLGVALELINALAVIGIAVTLFPVFKRHAEGMALGYVTLRVLEAVALTAAAFIPIALVTLGRSYGNAEAGAASSFVVLGDQLMGMRSSLLGILVPLFFCLGALLLYTWLYRAKVLPRFIPIWGFVGIVGIAALNLFAVGTTAAMILALPIILNELFLGGWLLFRGFSGDTAGARVAIPT